jgi:hypothetical protein
VQALTAQAALAVDEVPAHFYFPELPKKEAQVVYVPINEVH